MWPTLIPARASRHPEAFWRSLHYFNLYRLTVAGVFVASFVMFGPTLTLGSQDPALFFLASIGYVLFGTLSSVAISVRWPRFDLQLGAQLVADILFIAVLMTASGGVRSGLGLLLVVSLATTGLIGRGRLALFYAALAGIAVLGVQSFRIIRLDADSSDYFQTGLLSMGFFATAWLAHVLTQRLTATEEVAQQRGIDIANLAQINQLVIQDMQDGVLVVDARNRVRQCNAQAKNLLGDAYRLGGGEALLAECSPALAEQFLRWRADPRASLETLRIQATNKQLRTRFVLVGEEEMLGAVIFLEDLSRVQAQAQQLKLAALGRLTANIAHEIRNPLSAISHAAQLLLEESAPDGTQARLLQIIEDNTRRLDRMVQDVLRLNRRDRARPELIELGSFLAGFVEQFCQSENVPAAAFAIELDTSLPVCFDRGHLSQVLWNLCCNAWRHSRKQGGSIRICVNQAHRGSVVQLDVIDDGAGVAPELQHQLFEPFFTTDAQGTGLGLHLAREICAANGATLDYIEVAPGGQFRICCKGGSC